MGCQPKQLSVAEAVSAYLSPGDTVYLGNFGAQLFAVGHEMIRQRLTGLHVVAGSGGILLDQLIGARVASTVTFAHCWNPLGPAPAWNLRRAAERGEPSIEIRELSLGMLNAALTAAAWNVPFMPIRRSDDTGYVTDDWTGQLLSTVGSEFGSADIISALPLDCAFVHADSVDQLGNATMLTPFAEHLIAAQAAQRTVVVAEQITAGPREPGPRVPASLAGVFVTAIAASPGSVRPDGAPGRYPRDVNAYEEYARISSTEQGFSAWLAELDTVDGLA